jgi:hypothetical protein
MKPKTPTAGSQSDLDKFVDDLKDLSIHGSAMRIEEEFASGATSSGATTTSLGLGLFQSKDSRSRSRLGLRDLATDLQEANISESLSTFENDLVSHPIYKNINRAIIYAPGSSHTYIQQNHQDITTRISK